MSFFKAFMMTLIAVAAIVTPLGLHEGIVANSETVELKFHYIKDMSSMGYGTPPRDPNNKWSRLCGAWLIIPCPHDNNRASVERNSTGMSVDYGAEWYDTTIRQEIIEAYESGLSNLPDSVSSIWDIQWRTYLKDTVNDVAKGPKVDNGTARTIGRYQPLASLVMTDEITAIEGLIVDMKNGGIGFRNHTAPAFNEFGSEWTEDILWVAPDTVCVDTNTTLDFGIPRTSSEVLLTRGGQDSALYPVITDRGGYVNLNTTYPRWEIDDTQENPNLYYRAYRAAWLQNAFSMAYMNVTNMGNETLGQKAFQYLNSEMNKTFPLYDEKGKTMTSTSVSAGELKMDYVFGGIFTGTEPVSNISTIGNVTRELDFASKAGLFPNPFNVSRANWTMIDTLCRGQGSGDLANITHMAAKCGILYGAPRRNDSSPSLLFNPGSGWTLPMYACTSSAKASIKTVRFRFNGTTDDLSALEVLDVKDKVYASDAEKPLWGVENSDMMLADGSPLWGIVTEEASKKYNISTLRKEYLYLPGRDTSINYKNTPGVDFADAALDMTYMIGVGSTAGYSGRTNLAMYRKWQELSRNSVDSAKILNLVFTDIAANMVIGTRGFESRDDGMVKRDGSTPSSRTPPVTTYTKRVQYKYAYGIPAFLVLVLSVAAFTTTLFFMIFSGASPATMRRYLQYTSAGRLLASQQASGSATPQGTGYNGHTQQHKDDVLDAPSDVWIRGPGQEKFTIGPDGWSKSGGVPGYESKGGTTASYAPVPNPGGY